MEGNMAKAPGKDKVSELLGTIARTTPAASPPSELAETPTVATQAAAKPKATKRIKSVPRQAPESSSPAASGKFSSIYLNVEDQRILRELSAWFAGQGRKINDTLIIRTALRAVQTGSELLTAYDIAAQSDRRYKKHLS